MDPKTLVAELGNNARVAARQLAAAPVAVRNQALAAIGAAISDHRTGLLEANQKDLERGRSTGLDPALLDRLELTPARIDDLLLSLEQVASLADPVGAMDDVRTMDSGIRVGKMRVPLGVVGMIYESRPNVTVEAASLCLKSGNAVILRGGSEAIDSNRFLGALIESGLEQAGLDKSAVQVVQVTDRAVVGALIAAPEAVDVIIPRGGKGLIERVAADARVPVIKHLDVFATSTSMTAPTPRWPAIALNAKTQRYGTCNTMETLLVSQGMQSLLPGLVDALQQRGVELRGCPRSRKIAPAIAIDATEEDWGTEYLAPILSIRVVDDLEDAMEHIARYGSGHTESIVTEHHGRAMRFLREVDSSSVMVNASTRFADGFEYGLGAEIGISTDKFHARGPVGLEGLTSQKYVVFGEGHVRS
ncbi:glutamate-5-semialdehyde dehydrogenase [Luminiphilus syltensis NOR5-1B]|uniref:Gamma-glutamyl phosphate reductase n=1 Tax=Luminiphilus syltensis NOR5-1B TaxID=565045 RepID=B8KSM4_9GAMM|nr:glutamate-5-semialdehyde dehydrogenase [Luminiphilus syltensis]EED35169.1 glutamate-5-semialdehyde dehydrogenase [Luminiphilus syltensis NOR5-1B]